MGDMNYNLGRATQCSLQMVDRGNYGAGVVDTVLSTTGSLPPMESSGKKNAFSPACAGECPLTTYLK